MVHAVLDFLLSKAISSDRGSEGFYGSWMSKGDILMLVNVLVLGVWTGLAVFLREERCILSECLVSERPCLFRESYIQVLSKCR